MYTNDKDKKKREWLDVYQTSAKRKFRFYIIFICSIKNHSCENVLFFLLITNEKSIEIFNISSYIMISIYIFLILILNQIDNSSLLIVVRHIHLLTNNEEYNIQCPDNLNYLTVKLLNYSNEKCFNLYSISNRNICKNHYSPCQYHAKSIQLQCHHSYSNHVDITYQCSNTRHNLSIAINQSNPEDTIISFSIIFGIFIIIWIFICGTWFIYCYKSNPRIYRKKDTLIVHSLRLRVNPFENNHISSFRTTQFI